MDVCPLLLLSTSDTPESAGLGGSEPGNIARKYVQKGRIQTCAYNFTRRARVLCTIKYIGIIILDVFTKKKKSCRAHTMHRILYMFIFTVFFFLSFSFTGLGGIEVE